MMDLDDADDPLDPDLYGPRGARFFGCTERQARAVHYNVECGERQYRAYQSAGYKATGAEKDIRSASSHVFQTDAVRSLKQFVETNLLAKSGDIYSEQEIRRQLTHIARTSKSDTARIQALKQLKEWNDESGDPNRLNLDELRELLVDAIRTDSKFQGLCREAIAQCDAREAAAARPGRPGDAAQAADGGPGLERVEAET